MDTRDTRHTQITGHHRPCRQRNFGMHITAHFFLGCTPLHNFLGGDAQDAHIENFGIHLRGMSAQNPNKSFWQCPFQTTQSHVSNKQKFLAVSISNTPIPRIQKHLFWLMVCRAMGVWGATPETQTIFLALSVSNTPVPRIQKKTFSGPWCAEVWVFGAPPQNPNNILGHCPFQTPPSEVSKNTFWGSWCAEVRVFGAPPLNFMIFFGIVHFKHPHPEYPKTTFCGPWCVEVWVFGRN